MVLGGSLLCFLSTNYYTYKKEMNMVISSITIQDQLAEKTEPEMVELLKWQSVRKCLKLVSGSLI